mmetsp:Transcript_19143/g.52805  ORF Transcript_19143/g.52805 Transcript_19143/m.52805 type:complete len:618 (+) Transcript_19143:56-1909(+)
MTSMIRYPEGDRSEAFSWSQWESTAARAARGEEPQVSARKITDKMRGLSVKDTRFFEADGLFLDLTYITPNIIASARPATSALEATKKNPIDDLVSLIRHRHDNHVLIVNLVGEPRGPKYPDEVFPNVTHEFAFIDGQPPLINKVQDFCKTAHDFLGRYPVGAVLVHCEDGRSRTAMMVCSYLLFAFPQRFPVATEAISFFDKMRMKANRAALPLASQTRYVSYFSQRFAASPGKIRLSRVSIPNDVLRMSKYRIVIWRMVMPSASNNFTGMEQLFTTKGRQLGASEADDFNEYLTFDLNRFKLEYSGDLRFVFYGRKFALTHFTPLFELWINTGFVDHTPTIYDRACLDPLMSERTWRSLPEDFHVQFLYRDKPKVACDTSSSLAAQTFCWDCESPYMSEEESTRRHLPPVAFSATGLPELARDGPLHRFHSLLDEECALCMERLARETDALYKLEIEKAAAGGGFSVDAQKPKPRIQSVKDKFNDTLREQKTEVDLNQMQAFDRDEDTKSAQQLLFQRLQAIRNRKKLKHDERRRYEAEMAFGLGTPSKSNKASEFNAGRTPMEPQPPAVYCKDTDQYVCSWCSKYALNPAYRRFAFTLVDLHQLRYSGAARQKC